MHPLEISAAAQVNSIAANISLLETFGTALRDFFQRFDQITLFKQEPPRETDEAAIRLLAEGRYLLRSSGYRFHNQPSETAVLELLDLLRLYLPDRKNTIARIQDVFVTGKLEEVDFLSSVFNNQGSDVIRVARKFDWEEDVTMFFAVYLARPFRARAVRFLIDGLDLHNWLRGYCPGCGHWPALAHIDDHEGQRTLWCMHCETHWQYKRIQCVYCHNEEQDMLELIGPKPEPSHRAQVCTKCQRYLKEARSRKAVDKIHFDTVYLGTFMLDLLARNEGYIQESPLTVRNDYLKGKEGLHEDLAS
jgi:formate dehydrogenase maturation protein FdhE